MPGRTPASPWTDTFALLDEAREAKRRQRRPIGKLSHCWAHVHRQQEQDAGPGLYSRPYNRTQPSVRRKMASVLDKGREATGNNNMANGLPLPSCKMSSRRWIQCGWVADLTSACPPSVCARSTGAQDSRLHPIELSTSCPSRSHRPVRICCSV